VFVGRCEDVNPVQTIAIFMVKKGFAGRVLSRGTPCMFLGRK